MELYRYNVCPKITWAIKRWWDFGKEKSQQTRMFTGFSGGAGGIRTHVPFPTNWFRVSPVMTSSIPLHDYLHWMPLRKRADIKWWYVYFRINTVLRIYWRNCKEVHLKSLFEPQGSTYTIHSDCHLHSLLPAIKKTNRVSVNRTTCSLIL